MTQKASATTSTITVGGEFTFYDKRQDTYQGAWGAKVVLWEIDPALDLNTKDKLGTKYIQKDGSYSFTIPDASDDANDGDPLEVYIRIEPVNGNIRVKDNAGNVDYWRIPDSGTITLQAGETWSPKYIATGGEGYLHILRTLMEGWHHIYAETGDRIPQVIVHWQKDSTKGTYYDPASLTGDKDLIQLLGGKHDDEWDEDVILHEYGHHVMDEKYGYIPPGQSSHAPSIDTDKTTAWSEGWPTFFALAVQNDTEYDDLYEDGSTFAFNNIEQMYAIDSGQYGDGSPGGHDNEGSLMAAMWDVYDSQNDQERLCTDRCVLVNDTVEASFTTIWERTFAGQTTYSGPGSGDNVDTANEFWQSWFETHSNTAAMTEAWFHHELDYNSPPSGVLTSPTTDGWLTDPISISAVADDAEAIEKVVFEYQPTDTWITSGVDRDGNDGWDISWTSRITDSTVNTRVVVVDSVGRTDIDATDNTFGIDNTAPNNPTPTDGISGYTNQNDITFTWSNPGDEGIGVSGYYYALNDASPTNKYTQASTTSKSYSNLDDGKHTFYVKAYDGVNKESAVTSETVKIDTVSPESLVSMNGEPKSWTNNAEITIVSDDEIDTTKIDPAGIAKTCWQTDQASNCEPATTATTKLSTGKHTFQYWSVDTAGNTENRESAEIWIDTKQPTTPSRLTDPDDWVTQSTLTLSWASASDEHSGVDYYEYKVNNGEWRTTTDTEVTLTNLQDTSYTISVRTVDNAGNPSDTTTAEFRVDTTGPPIRIDTPAPNAITNDTTVYFEGSSSDAFSTTKTVEYRIDGGEWVTAATGTGHIEFTTRPLADGTHTVTIRATDEAGNSNTIQRTITIDTTPPNQPSPTGPSGWTDNTQPRIDWQTVTDTASGVDYYEYQIDGTDGSWTTVQDGTAVRPASLSDGTHTIYVRAVDKTGNPSTAGSTTVRIDTTPPEAPPAVTPPSNWVNTSSPTITWTAASDGLSGIASYEVQVGSNSWRAVGADTTATLQPLTTGTYTVRIRAIDAAGNPGSTASATVKIDRTTPTATATVGPTDGVTNKTKVTLSGTAQDDHSGVTKVAYRVNQGAWHIIQNSGGAWTTQTDDLTEGRHTITIRVTDAAGNTEQTTTNVTIDTTAPTAVAVSAPEWTNASTVPLSWTPATDSRSRVVAYDVRIDDGHWSRVGNTTNAGVSVREGKHTVAIRAVDAAGNVGPVTEVTIKVDRTPPTKPENLQGPTTWTNDSTPSFEWSAANDTMSGVSHYQVQIDGKRWQSVDATDTTLQKLSSGRHTVAVRAIDMAGNPSGQITTEVKIDTHVPNVTVAAPSAAFVSNNTTLTITVDASDARAGIEAVAYKIDNGDWHALKNTSTLWHTSTPSLTEGRHAITVRAEDAAGNTNTTTRAVTIDTTPPATTIAYPRSDNQTLGSPGDTITIGITYTDATPRNATVLIRNETTIVGNRTINLRLDGHHQTTLTVPIAPSTTSGTYNVTVTTRDRAGNSNMTTAIDAVRIDTRPPAVTAVTMNRSLVAPGAPIHIRVSATDNFGLIAVTANNTTLTPTKDQVAWTGTIIASTTEGTHTLPITATDSAGNSIRNTTTTYQVDATPPWVRLSDPEYVNTSEVTITGSVGDKHGLRNITISNETSTWQLTTTEGKFTTTVPLPHDGRHRFVVTATDTVGNQDSSQFELVRDTVPPTATLSRPPVATNDITPRVRINRTDDRSGINASAFTLTLDGQTVTDSATITQTGAISYQPEELSPGTHTLTARIQDRAGNVHTNQWTFTIDTKGPVITTAELSESSLVPGESVDVAVTATDSRTNVTTVRFAGTPLTPHLRGWRGTIHAQPSIGLHTATVVAVDDAGNRNQTTVPYKVGKSTPLTKISGTTYQATPNTPTIRTITINTSTAISNTTATVGTAQRNPQQKAPPNDTVVAFPQIETHISNDNINTATITLQFNKSTFTTQYVKPTAANIYWWNGSDWHRVPGRVVNTTATTVAYNVTTTHFSTFAVTGDTESTSPTITNTTPAPGATLSDQTPTIEIEYTDTFAGVNPASVSITIDGSPVEADVTATTSQATVTPTLTTGTHTIRVRIADRANNRRTKQWSFTIESTSTSDPSGPSTTPSNQPGGSGQSQQPSDQQESTTTTTTPTTTTSTTTSTTTPTTTATTQQTTTSRTTQATTQSPTPTTSTTQPTTTSTSSPTGTSPTTTLPDTDTPQQPREGAGGTTPGFTPLLGLISVLAAVILTLRHNT